MAAAAQNGRTFSRKFQLTNKHILRNDRYTRLYQLFDTTMIHVGLLCEQSTTY